MRTASNTEDGGQSKQTEQCKSEEVDYTGRREQQTYHQSSSFIGRNKKRQYIHKTRTECCVKGAVRIPSPSTHTYNTHENQKHNIRNEKSLNKGTF